MAKGKQFTGYILLSKNYLKTTHYIIIFSNIIMPFIPFKRGKRKPLRRRPLRAKKPKRTMAKLIKSVIQTQTEIKRVQQEGEFSFGGWLNNATLNVKTLGPSPVFMPIDQGTQQGQRCGVKIRTKKVTLKMIILPNPYNATNNVSPGPMEILVYIGRCKNKISTPVALDFNNFYQAGNTSLAPDGSLMDAVSYVNKDYWTITRQFRFKVGTAEYGGTAGVPAQQYYSNNDYKFNAIRTVDLTKSFAATYQFNDALNDPTNSQTYMMIEAVGANGNAFGPTQLPAKIIWQLDYQYTDL